jgi:hypothetical protein
MKTAEEWTAWIMVYLKTNPVKTVEEAFAQLSYLVEIVQKDAMSANSDELPPLVPPIVA